MPCPSLRSLTAALSAALAITLGGAASSAFAIGTITDINVVDRTTGQVLPVYTHQGRHYVAGRPGARYAVRVHNKAGGRVMTVLSVDGINVVSGETAGIEQNGYVLSSWQRHDVAGWRKSQAQVAAFEFTALPNSYAARTGRPDNVGGDRRCGVSRAAGAAASGTGAGAGTAPLWSTGCAGRTGRVEPR